MPIRGGFAEAPAQLDRADRRAVDEDDRELVLAPSAHEILGAQHVAPARGGFTKKLLLSRVPFCALGAGPVVERDEGEAEWMLAAPGVRDVTRRLGEKLLTIRQDGKTGFGRLAAGEDGHLLTILDAEHGQVCLRQIVLERVDHSHRHSAVESAAKCAAAAEKPMG